MYGYNCKTVRLRSDNEMSLQNLNIQCNDAAIRGKGSRYAFDRHLAFEFMFQMICTIGKGCKSSGPCALSDIVAWISQPSSQGGWHANFFITLRLKSREMKKRESKKLVSFFKDQEDGECGVALICPLTICL